MRYEGQLSTGKHLQTLSSLNVSTDSMISRAMKSHTIEHTVRGRPTLKDVQRFRNGSVRKPNERSIYERTFMSEPNRGKLIPKL